MASDQELSARRAEAQAAMEGEVQKARRAEQEKTVAKRRVDARLAMEGDSHRRQREEKERQAKGAEAERQKRAVAQAASQVAETQKRAAQAADINRRRELEEATRQKRYSNIERAETVVEQLKTKKLDISPLRTYKSDMARAVKEEGVSIAKIAISEATRGHLTDQGAAEPGANSGKIKKILVAIGVGLAILGLAGWGGLSWWKSRATTPLPLPPGQNIIFAETTQNLDITNLPAGGEVLRALQSLVSAHRPAEGSNRDMVSIKLTRGSQPLGLDEFQQAVLLNIPADLRRHLNDDYMLGSFYNGEVNLPFLIFTTRFYDQAFAGMLDWEEHGLPQQVLAVFRPGSVNPAELNPPFKDKLVRNKDARRLTNKQGHTLLFYAFLDKQTIAITRNEEVFLELFDRFTNL